MCPGKAARTRASAWKGRARQPRSQASDHLGATRKEATCDRGAGATERASQREGGDDDDDDDDNDDDDDALDESARRARMTRRNQKKTMTTTTAEEEESTSSSSGGLPAAVRTFSPSKNPAASEASLVRIASIASRAPSTSSASSDAISRRPFNRFADGILVRPDDPLRCQAAYGGFLSSIEAFDNDAFRMSPLESVVTDPQQRILLEVGHECLSGAPGGGLGLGRDKHVAVHVGIMAMEYALSLAFLWAPRQPEVYSITGSGLSVASGRLSFVFRLTGPAISVDTACSSSLVGLALALKHCRGPRGGKALACGTNALVARRTFEFIHRAGMLAIDGRCKTLDASANGYTRAEAVQVVLLVRSQDQGEAAIGVLGGAINQDGRSASLTAPSGPAQQEMLHQALEDADLGVFDLEGIQMHGTGSRLGDPIEIAAIEQNFSRGGSHSEGEGKSLFLSASKSVLGHAEAAAGLNGVIQAIGVATQASAAPFVHLRTLNPYLHSAFETLPKTRGVSFVAARQRSPCNASLKGGMNAHGVSAFAFQGTNAHVVLRSLAAAGSAAPSLASRQGLKTWHHKFFWYAHPTHPVLTTFETTVNAHNDLIAEARVDLSSPHLSYLRQVKVGGRSILGASVYVDAVGSLVSSMVDAESDLGRPFALSNLILGEPNLLVDSWAACSSKRIQQKPLLRLQIHTQLGLVNSGLVESMPTISFAGNVMRRCTSATQGCERVPTGASSPPWTGDHSSVKAAGACARISLRHIENVSEYVLHPAVFENTVIASARCERSALFPVQMAHISLAAPLKKVTGEFAQVQTIGDALEISLGEETSRMSIHDIVYARGKERNPIQSNWMTVENVEASASTSTSACALDKYRLSPASDEDCNSPYTLEDFKGCQVSFNERCQYVGSSTLRDGEGSLGSASFGSDVDMVKKLVCDITGSTADEIEDEEPLIGAGLDSIASLELRTKLQDMLGVQLPVTLLHDYPSISSLRSLVDTTSQTLSSQDGDGQSSTSLQSEHFQPALYLPFLFKPSFIISLKREKDQFLAFWFPTLVYFITIFVPFFWAIEVLQHLVLYVWDGKYREYKVALEPVSGMEDSPELRERTVPLTQDDASYSHVYVSACLEFDHIVSEVNLCRSLQIALSHFPSLAGNLVRKGRNMYLRYGGEKDFVRVLAHEYKRQKDMHFKSGMIQEPVAKAVPGWMQTLHTINSHILYAYRCAKPRGHPCMKIYIHQNIKMDRPKTLITVRWNHAVADGSTINTFLGAWGMADKGRRVLSTHLGPAESLSDRQHALLAKILMEESRSSLYFPCKSFWSPPYNSVLIRFTAEEIRAHQARAEGGQANAIDVVSSLLWLAMANVCYPREEQIKDDKFFDYASWHPKLSFLVDMRNYLPELQCFTGNMVRCIEPFCPMKDPLSDLKMRSLGEDVAETMCEVGRQRKKRHFSMRAIEEYMRVPGVPLCMQKMQEMLMQGGSGPCLLVNDLTSFRGPFNFGCGSAEVSPDSFSSDWSPGDASLTQTLEDVDLSSFDTNPFWFAHLKNDGGDIVCALVTFS